VSDDPLAFHLGALDHARRDDVESHLLGCPDCLRGFLALTRSLKLEEDGPSPSPSSRERLRRAILDELAGPERARWRWWERPLAFGLAATAALLALSAVRTVSSGPGAAPHGIGDTATQRRG
jgi:Putative zinc-finger